MLNKGAVEIIYALERKSCFGPLSSSEKMDYAFWLRYMHRLRNKVYWNDNPDQSYINYYK